MFLSFCLSVRKALTEDAYCCPYGSLSSRPSQSLPNLSPRDAQPEMDLDFVIDLKRALYKNSSS